jgi:hypothetical protein
VVVAVLALCAPSAGQLAAENGHANRTQLAADCKPLAANDAVHQRWVLGENAMNGLSNQLFGTYSYAPVAMLWGVNLVVGDVYSRSSFEVKVKKYEGWLEAPFSSFFDWQHFQRFWLERGLVTAQASEFHESCAARMPVVEVLRVPHFYCQKDAVIMKMLTSTGLQHPIANHSLVLRFDSLRPKFTALYNFWKGGLRTKLLLLTVHRSLLPAPPLQAVASAMLAALPVFIVAHLRLEADFLLYHKKDFNAELQTAVEAVRSHRCLLQHVPRDTALYVASGLFNSSEASQQGQEQQLLAALRGLGFRHIHTRQSLLSGILQGLSQTQAQGQGEALRETVRTLLPEQAAMVDLVVSRSAACFVPAHASSSFSYMAQRMRSLDNGQVLRYGDINERNYGKSFKFKEWGV